MSTSPPLLRQCLQLALAEAPALLKRGVEGAVERLQQLEASSTELGVRQALATAAQGLREQQPRWERAIAARWRDAIEGRCAPVSQRAALSDSQFLSLVDDDTIADTMASARWLQDLQPQVETELALLDSLMSSLQGLGTIQADRNPLRPVLFLDAWRELMQQAEPDATVRQAWMRHSAQPLGLALGDLYQRVNTILQRAQVQEAGYRVRLAVDGGAAHSRRASLPESPQDGEGSEDGARSIHGELPSQSELGRLQASVAQRVLRAFLEEDAQPFFDQPLGSSYYRQVAQALAEMAAGPAPAPVDESVLEQRRRRYSDLPAVDRPARPVDIGTELSEQGWGAFAAPQERSRVLLQLKQQAQRAEQAMGLELVRTLVNQVAGDAQLLAPVREAVVALEPSLLRLALANPRFFNEEDHPARRLVESVAQRSFQYNDEFSPAFDSFFQPVQAAFNALNEDEHVDETAFALAQSGLQRLWQEQDDDANALQEESLHAIRHADERQALADQVAWDLSLRPDVHGAPPVILEFLYGPWSLVIAAAELADPQREPGSQAFRDPGGYRKVVSQLLWSVKKDVTLKRPAQLFEMVPGMLSTLHAGLELLGKTREETQPFFDALMRLHQPVLALRRARSRSDAVNSSSSPLEAGSAHEWRDGSDPDESAPTPAPPDPSRGGGQPWLARHELEAAGFQDTLPTENGELDELCPVEAPRTDSTEEAGHDGGIEAADLGWNKDASSVLAGLHEGRWVDLYSHQEWLRAQLIWASARGTLFMFVSRGGRSHSMTRRVCERLVSRRLLRLVASGPVVEKALSSLAQTQAAAVEAETA